MEKLGFCAQEYTAPIPGSRADPRTLSQWPLAASLYPSSQRTAKPWWAPRHPVGSSRVGRRSPPIQPRRLTRERSGYRPRVNRRLPGTVKGSRSEHEGVTCSDKRMEPRSESASTSTSPKGPEANGGLRRSCAEENRGENREQGDVPETGEAKESSSTDQSTSRRGRRGGLRSHRGAGGRTKDQLYAEAEAQGHRGSFQDDLKAELERAVLLPSVTFLLYDRQVGGRSTVDPGVPSPGLGSHHVGAREVARPRDLYDGCSGRTSLLPSRSGTDSYDVALNGPRGVPATGPRGTCVSSQTECCGIFEARTG